MILIDDLYQLPPVITGAEGQVFRSLYDTPYFYSARALDSFDMEFVELEKIYWQHDGQFINLLNSMRNNPISEDGLQLLNRRYMPEFEPSSDDFCVPDHIGCFLQTRCAGRVDARKAREREMSSAWFRRTVPIGQNGFSLHGDEL